MANIVITGANRGIGLALVKNYVAGGDRVHALCRNPDQAAELKQIATTSAGQLTLHPIDMADGQSIDAVAQILGDTPVDVLLNVAGIIGGRIDSLANTTFTEDDFADWRNAFEVMTIGPFRLTQALLPNLLAAKGKVMTVSTQIAASTWDRGGMYAYGATKAAVNRLMLSLAIDLKAKGVCVATIHPGYVQTDMGGPNAEITPQESAAGIKNVVDKLTLETSGSFFKWNGELHPW
ncbi:SDR family oxidoreductase [Pseudomonas sp. MYb185]|uniref:SDR family oxidoreductase n=1 Tax=Pseudomonas sp. MYb185 TaxID=1848729 RepID=UPI000CFB059B|nr:SDR family oxidoreductase [Pseudomonas sp. MYb185]PRB79959.1 short-chain dehydrogenase [Pseudomonas sp. MYb185]